MKYLFLFVLCIIPCIGVCAKIEIFDISYNLDQFSITCDQNGLTHVNSSNPIFVFEGEGLPAIPSFPVSIAVGEDEELFSMNYEFQKRLIAEDVDVALYSYFSENAQDDEGDINIKMNLFPDSVCRYVSKSKLNGVGILHFRVSPFIVDSKERKLYFVDNVRLAVSLRTSNGVNQITGNVIEQDQDIVKGVVINPFDVDLLSCKESRIGMRSPRIDYVIITSEELKPYFEPLRQWKQTKGVASKIITLEEIRSNFPGETDQMKIKNCLYNLYSNNRLRFVLLGGDDTIIPVKRCFGYVRQTVRGFDPNIASDAFYACFDGDFSWTITGDELITPLYDEINFTPSICVSRLPVRDGEEVGAYVKKLLTYEKLPDKKKSMLMVGVDTSNFPIEENMHSNSELLGDLKYEQFIKPYWDGLRERYFDTDTSFPNGNDFDVTRADLQNLLSLAFGFVNVCTHGSQSGWSMESGAPFSTINARNLVNDGFTVITTTSCLTNAFDTRDGVSEFSKDPCLSEAFIRNPKSGVVAYLGSSSFGFGSGSDDYLEASDLYDALFYKFLFSPVLREKNFGAVVANAKIAMLPFCKKNGKEKFLQYSLNAVGDPEMPIYTSLPKLFNEVVVTPVDENSIRIWTGVDSCRVCIMSSSDFGESFYQVEENVNSVFVEALPCNVTLCVTKQDYMPKQYSIEVSNGKMPSIRDNAEYAGETLSCSRMLGCIATCEYDVESGITRVVCDIPESISAAVLYILDMAGSTVAVERVSSIDRIKQLNMSVLASGAYLAVLVSDTNVADTYKFFKK